MKVNELIAHLRQYDQEQFVLIQDREGWCYDIASITEQHVDAGEVIFPEEKQRYDDALVTLVLVPD